MSEKLRAPWDRATVEALNRYQFAGVMHHYTCARDTHQKVVLVATKGGWVCPIEACDYTQDWAHAFSTDPELTEPRRWP